MYLANNIWFTADQHFFHQKMCDLRGFDSVAQMNSQLIENHNSLVSKDDHVFILGDFSLGSFEDTIKVLKKLNGNKFLVRGNHDKHKNPGFAWIKDLYELNYGGKCIVLCHYPIEVWNKKHYGSIHLHGHSHGKSRVVENRYDVGVDTNGLKPYNLEDIIN